MKKIALSVALLLSVFASQPALAAGPTHVIVADIKFVYAVETHKPAEKPRIAPREGAFVPEPGHHLVPPARRAKPCAEICIQ